MSKVKDLEHAQHSIEQLEFMFANLHLLQGINEALAVPEPVGDPGAVRARAKDYAQAASSFGQASQDLAGIATNQLPAVWTGSVAEHATQAIHAMSAETTTSKETLAEAARLLDAWANELEWAKRTDADGCRQLKEAGDRVKDDLGGFDADARATALSGVGARLAAARRAESSGTSTASKLNQLTSKARASRAGEGSLDPLAAVVLATEKNPGAGEDDGYILTPGQLDRATQTLGVMTGADQAAFRALLSGAKSPEEAAYLWKALAAGHSVADIQKFDAGIHPHGDDPAWLAQHLVPATSTTDINRESSDNIDLTYQGQQVNIDGYGVYSQRNVNDCVAASTVIAQAKLDPLLMYQLTTGGTPDEPGADSAQNFEQRLQKTYVDEYIAGQKADGQKTYPKEDSGLGPKAQTYLADKDLGKATGADYEHVELESDADRRAALARIEKSVDEGLPVPISVRNEDEGHQMMIIGRDGDKLQIYNPWGFTSWVTEDQFVNSQLGGLTPGEHPLNKSTALELPK
ncbi:WXG100 family type VII secretion target [Kitasatospora sp. NPDC056181]|uniref:WXG100 family type VII secretion target n=1 Tax=Kitasatospora sp. NPDC056181 TaxID=3345737 RepID=UPI0035D5EBF6